MKACLAILKKWDDILPELDYRAVEAMYSLIDEKIEITLTVGYCEYYKSLSGQIGFFYDYSEGEAAHYQMTFPGMHGRKHRIRKEWIAHVVEIDQRDMCKATAVKYLEEHPEWKT